VIRAAEYVLLFFGLVGAYAAIGSPGSPIPVLLVLGLGALVWLRRQPGFDRADLGRPSAAAFGFAHLMFGTVASVALTLVGGWLFARTYQRTRSLLAASVEHALYGVLAFTIGLGDLFYSGAR
jgi:hypothetical protein